MNADRPEHGAVAPSRSSRRCPLRQLSVQRRELCDLSLDVLSLVLRLLAFLLFLLFLLPLAALLLAV